MHLDINGIFHRFSISVIVITTSLATQMNDIKRCAVQYKRIGSMTFGNADCGYKTGQPYYSLYQANCTFV